MSHRLIGFNTIHDSLVEVSGGNVPGLGAEEHVVAVVDLGQVIEGASLLGVWQCICTGASNRDDRTDVGITHDRLAMLDSCKPRDKPTHKSPLHIRQQLCFFSWNK